MPSQAADADIASQQRIREPGVSSKMNLTDREKEMLKGMVDRGEPLPPR